MSTTACGTRSQPQAEPIATESDDYGLRHPVAAAADPIATSLTTTACGTPPHSHGDLRRWQTLESARILVRRTVTSLG